MKKQNIEVEGGEILIMSKEGHYAVIPAKHRQEVMDMIKDGCDNCINNYIQTLPKDNDYAEDGSLLPDWDKVKATLNPYNWGVKDYTDKGSFEAAYSSARKDGEKEFMWNNKRFNTKYDGTSEQQLKETGITDERMQKQNIVKKQLYNNLQPRGYEDPIKRTYRALLGINSGDVHDMPHREDAWALYMGKPQKYNTLGVSKYKPSKASEDNVVYYTINNIGNENFEDVLLTRDIDAPYNPDKDYNDVMGNFKLDKGEDEHGKYISYYDIWDLNPFALKNPINKKEITTDIGKPFEIYNRVYYRENPNANKFAEYDKKIDELWDLAIKTQDHQYLEEAYKLYPIRNSYYNQQGKKYIRQYYSDKELSELDVNKKNFDTLALQKELSNRGYKLPKSTKKDGTFDGVWGEETKAALLDYQKSQNKNKVPYLFQSDETKNALNKSKSDKYIKNQYNKLWSDIKIN